MPSSTPTPIAVTNWDKHQHYKKPKPPWIKVYRDVLGDYSFSRLSIEQRYTVLCLWLLAAETDNQIPNDPEWLQKRLDLTAPPNLQVIADAGFITGDYTSSRQSLDKLYPQTEESRGRVEEKQRQKTEIVSEFEECWEQYAKGKGSNGPKPKAREYWLKLSLADREGIKAAIPDYLAIIAQGRTKKEFRGWINPANREWDQDWKSATWGDTRANPDDQKISPQDWDMPRGTYPAKYSQEDF